MKVGFIGLGIMGAPMALRLAEAGHQLSVFDISATALRRFENKANCKIGGSPADVAHLADYVITMLPETAHVKDALFGPKGAAAQMTPGAMVIEMSTGDATAYASIGRKLAERQLRMIDAPVGRTPQDAASGTLLVIAGGSVDDLSDARPILDAMADEIVHAGPLGSGIKTKLVNNYMSMVGMVMTAEALAFSERLELDIQKTVHVIRSTAAGRGQINVNFPNKVLKGDVTPDFPLRLGLKDISLALELAKSVGAPVGLGAVSQQLFALAKSWGRSEQDCTAMLLLLQDIAGGHQSDL